MGLLLTFMERNFMKWVYRCMLPVLLLLSAEAKSQAYVYHPFPDSNFTWKGYTACIGGGGHWSCNIRGDTLINGITYKNIGNIASILFMGSIRVDTSKKVFFYNYKEYVNHERLLYDFSFSVGDTISSLATGELLNVYLVDTPSYFGIPRRTLHLRTAGGADKDKWIEGVGSHLGPLSLSKVSPGYCAWSCLCQAFDDSLLVFERNDYLSNLCFPTSSILEVKGLYIVKVYPNPSTTYFTLQLSSSPSTPTHFQLYDALGRPVMREAINTETTALQRGNLPTGIYFWQLESANKILGRGKVVME